MKKFTSFLLLTIMLMGIVSCNESSKSEQQKANSDLKLFVDSIHQPNFEYNEDNWIVIENDYKLRAEKAERELAKMNEEEKIEFEASKKRYQELNTKYQKELALRRNLSNAKLKIRNSLLGEGKVGLDMSFSFVNPTNILDVTQTFVDVVDANKKEYSREDWDEIKLLYEALDTRKNEIEREMNSTDNRKIAGLKIKFVSIYNVKRPLSKALENAEAKE